MVGTGGKKVPKDLKALCHLKPFFQSDRAFLTTLGTDVLNQKYPYCFQFF